MTDYDTILIADDGAVRTITLNRPASLNAMNRAMLNDLRSAFAAAEADPAVRVLILTGAPRQDGRPCFCAGADIKEGGHGGSPAGEPLAHTIASAFELALGNDIKHVSPYAVAFAMLEQMRTPSIAVIDGVCTTGGLELILACDLRIVGESASISDWHIRNMGVVGGAGVTTRLPQLVGTAKAKELLWTGEPVDGAEAVRIGLANRVYPSASLRERSLAFANVIAEQMPAAVAASKAIVNASRSQTPDEGVRYANLWGALIAAQKEQGLATTPPRPI